MCTESLKTGVGRSRDAARLVRRRRRERQAALLGGRLREDLREDRRRVGSRAVDILEELLLRKDVARVAFLPAREDAREALRLAQRREPQLLLGLSAI